MTIKARIFHDIRQERTRQDELKKLGKFEFTCGEAGSTMLYKLGVLFEETGEVAHEVMDRTDLERKYEKEGIEWNFERRQARNAKLYAELVQVAAVAVAWCEFLYKDLPPEEHDGKG